ncbi:30S ribosomal protein S4 [Candidatus Falkowbacteria bacterium RIFCSPLOWO2_12_FULL_45_13]|uniref:Small ribosomal subunit protein uS4 n=2 Tax=Candidatus Falkowiibacteriota TaxID=1752728 RepID=A0A1F5SBH7_9BACT|nr:MAG: 30S ribosomal protein S4 [Candidatus Falkowbacteria bacterium RIFCSPLOWO2_02_FULL_45_21]OGF31981.1 MAG: 30S ribosomal protein S4 [Candidatus Falkowbacteria bacterium RIFCSPLOWO2_12_FULL_45_13]
MSKYLGPKCKLCRREGEKLMLKGERCKTAKCAIVKKNYPPGVHGPKGRATRQSGYNLQLREKQKAKRIYNLQEKQFKLSFNRAIKQKGDAGENLLKILETRLDNVIYRLGLAASRAQARSLVAHGHFKVNDKKVDIPSYNVATGDIIKIKPASQRNRQFASLAEKLKTMEIPSWLNFEIKGYSAKVLHLPSRENFELKINAPVIVEFYSR